MKFFNWTTTHADYSRTHSKMPFDEFVQWRKEQLASMTEYPASMRRFQQRKLDIEISWARKTKPYYKIHPQLVGQLCKVDLTKIPANLIEMPLDQSVVSLRLAQQHPEFTVFDSEFGRIC